MGKLNIITGIYVAEQWNSPINGKVSVVKSIAFGTYIQAGNLTQSGGVVYEIWKKALRKIYKSQITNHHSLILGLGGGSVAKIIDKLWPEAKITGVDIDPIMVELGKKYLGLDKIKLDVVIDDAEKYLIHNTKYKIHAFDLICVDLYVGDESPKKFESDAFLKLIHRLLSVDGVVVFNRLYYGEKRKQTMLFGEKAKKCFSKVEYFFPEANLMLICTL